jgi:ubiquinone/menaquinone biosynthesis C-methylase UbiE
VGLYARFVVPRLIDLAMRQKMLREHRAAVVPKARGTVLEVGIGSARNLPYYSTSVERLYGIDPSSELLAMAQRNARTAGRNVELVCESAERLPFADAMFDSVLITWTLCSIPDPARALREMRRVMKPGGHLHFIEHGFSREPSVAAWQRRLTPIWQRIAGGCHLDRRIDALIRAAGFELIDLQNFYVKGPRPLTYMYEGTARA